MTDPNEIRLIQTEDGSSSLFVPALNETYHSRHGAMRESLHVFIESGLKNVLYFKSEIRILEIGFGTGLNAWLTAKTSALEQATIHYTTLETVILPSEITDQLNYASTEEDIKLLNSLHAAEWGKDVFIHPGFTLHKVNQALQDYQSAESFDLIYYDAFGPPSQPDMWRPELFVKLYNMSNRGARFVTYCAKGQVRRDLEAAGWEMDRIPGPPGKREMLRGKKING